MSASLVGSEMCIRDSTRAQRERKGSRAQAITHPARRTQHRSAERSSEPVSYTHLTLPTICSV
eukprot:6384839-Alexandrium_andersonii.AAC.1